MSELRKTSVLFLCTGNSCRSQMAEGFLRHWGGDRFEAASAGTNPTTVNPLAIRAMAEVGVDLGGQESKGLKPFLGRRFAYVVTVCDRAKESCPVFPGALKRLTWSFEDPADAEGTDEERLVVFRKVRDEIADHVRRFIEDAQ